MLPQERARNEGVMLIPGSACRWPRQRGNWMYDARNQTTPHAVEPTPEMLQKKAEEQEKGS